MLTPSLPERAEFREDCIQSVLAQEGDYVASHLIEIDHDRTGVAATLNRLWPRVTTPWIQILADDDLLDPDYFVRLFEHMRSDPDASIYHTLGRLEGLYDRSTFIGEPFDYARMLGGNYIPATVLVKTSLVRQLDGYTYPKTGGWEDWFFFLRAARKGARFSFLDEPLWTYRFHDENVSYGPLPRGDA